MPNEGCWWSLKEMFEKFCFIPRITHHIQLLDHWGPLVQCFTQIPICVVKALVGIAEIDRIFFDCLDREKHVIWSEKKWIRKKKPTKAVEVAVGFAPPQLHSVGFAHSMRAEGFYSRIRFWSRPIPLWSGSFPSDSQISYSSMSDSREQFPKSK